MAFWVGGTVRKVVQDMRDQCSTEVSRQGKLGLGFMKSSGEPWKTRELSDGGGIDGGGGSDGLQDGSQHLRRVCSV